MADGEGCLAESTQGILHEQNTENRQSNLTLADQVVRGNVDRFRTASLGHDNYSFGKEGLHGQRDPDICVDSYHDPKNVIEVKLDEFDGWAKESSSNLQGSNMVSDMYKKYLRHLETVPRAICEKAANFLKPNEPSYRTKDGDFLALCHAMKVFPTEWLSDDFINMYLYDWILCKKDQIPKRRLILPLSFQALVNIEECPHLKAQKNVSIWHNNFLDKFISDNTINVEEVYVPLHDMSRRHWFLLVVNFTQQCNYILDSLSGQDHQHELVKNLLEKASAVLKKYPHIGQALSNAKDFEIKMPNTKKQPNSFDCGMYVLKYIEEADNSNWSSISYTTDEMAIERLKYFVRLITSVHNHAIDFKRAITDVSDRNFVESEGVTECLPELKASEPDSPIMGIITPRSMNSIAPVIVDNHQAHLVGCCTTSKQIKSLVDRRMDLREIPEVSHDIDRIDGAISFGYTDNNHRTSSSLEDRPADAMTSVNRDGSYHLSGVTKDANFRVVNVHLQNMPDGNCTSELIGSLEDQGTSRREACEYSEDSDIHLYETNPVGKTLQRALRNAQMDILTARYEHGIAPQDQDISSRDTGRSVGSDNSHHPSGNGLTNKNPKGGHVKGSLQNIEITLETLQSCWSRKMTLEKAAKEHRVSRSTMKRKLRDLNTKWPSSRTKKQFNSAKKCNTASAPGRDSSQMNVVDRTNLLNEENGLVCLDAANQQMSLDPISSSEINVTATDPVADTRMAAQNEKCSDRLPESVFVTRHNESASSFIVKAQYKEDIARIELFYTSTIDELRVKLGKKFGLESSRFKLKYHDGADELILMTEWSDVAHALRVSRSFEEDKRVVRLWVMDV